MKNLGSYRYKAATVITVFFVVFITFLTPNSVVKTMKLRRDIKEMRTEQEIFRESARRDSAFIENLRDDEFLEKYAREKLYMKRKGEQIYVIEEKKPQ